MKAVTPKAKLIDYTDNPERNVATAAKLCYSDKGAEELQKEMTDEQVEKLVRKVIELGHTSTLEHTNFFFSIRCSRVCSHQLVRQRVGTSYSQRSQRYVKEDDFAFIVPPSIENNDEALDIYLERMSEGKETYNKLLDMDIPKEDARFVLPTIKTNLVVSYNARSLRYFVNLRACRRAQWEIRDIAEQMLEQAKEVAPILFEGAGPDCIASGINRCTEGELTCGNPRDELR